MHRPRHTRGRHAEGLSHHVGETRNIINRRVELGHGLERRNIVDLLIHLAELGFRVAAAGHGDHWGVREEGIAQAGSEVHRADHLRHADAGPSAGAGVAVRHIGRRLFAVHVQPLDIGAAFHHGKGLAQHGRHMKHMRYPIALEHVGEAFRPAHYSIVSEHDDPLREIL